MRKRRPAADTTPADPAEPAEPAEHAEPADRPGPSGPSDIETTVSPFDAAQDLLQAALDEIRGVSAPAPSGRPAPVASAPAPSTRPAPVASAPAPSTRPAPVANAPETPTERPPAPVADDNPWRKPDPVTTDSTDELWAAAPARRTDSIPSRRATHRRRRTASRPAPPVPAEPTPTGDEFDGLTETLYAPPTSGTRRQRRPAAAAAASSATTSSRPPAPVPGSARQPEPAPPADPGPGTGAEIEAIMARALADADPVTRPADPVTPVITRADAAPVVDPSAEAWTVPPAPHQAHSRNRNRRIAVAAAVVVALVVGLLVVVSGGGSDEPALRAGGQARLSFPSVTTAEGAQVTRVWTLGGERGNQFVGTLTFANTTNSPTRVLFTEVIPKSLAADVSEIEFDPEPIVIDPDPVVSYALIVPAGGTVVARYEIAVAPDGARRERLERWAEELEATPVPTTTTVPIARPTPPTAQAAGPSTTSPGRSSRGSTNAGRGSQGTTSPGRGSQGTSPEPPATNPPPTEAPSPPPSTNPPPTNPPPTNPPPTVGTLVIQAFSAGGTGTFGYATPNGGISLTTVGSPHGSASWSATVDPGEHTITQTSTPSAFYLYGIECSNGFAASNPATTVTVTVNPGETVSCRFVNAPS